jgi:TonB family protein
MSERLVSRPWLVTAVACVVSGGFHVAVGGGLFAMDREKQPVRKATVIRVIRQRPSVKTPQAPAASEKTSTPKTKPRRIKKITAGAPTPNQRAKQPAKIKPVFGVSMDSTVSSIGAGMSAQVGNTLAMAPKKTKLAPQAVKPTRAAPIRQRLAPVPSYKLTAMPQPKTLVKAKYPEEARAAGIEGETLLKLHIDEQGRVTEVEVITGIGQQLDQLAVSAARRFRFEPARVGKVAVPTVIPFTYQWEIEG